MTPTDPGGPEAAAKRWVQDGEVHVDVRGLAPPQPLVVVLKLIESLDDGAVVVVHLDRDPQMLYPELAEIGWSAERVDAAPGEVRLRLRLERA